jgi:hypothetical protein
MRRWRASGQSWPRNVFEPFDAQRGLVLRARAARPFLRLQTQEVECGHPARKAAHPARISLESGRDPSQRR